MSDLSYCCRRQVIALPILMRERLSVLSPEHIEYRQLKSFIPTNFPAILYSLVPQAFTNADNFANGGGNQQLCVGILGYAAGSWSG
jgi:hypothetical protein